MDSLFPFVFLTIGYGLDMQKYGLFYSKTKETIFTNYIQTKIRLVQRFFSALFSSAIKKQMIIEFFENMIRILHQFRDQFLEQLILSVK